MAERTCDLTKLIFQNKVISFIERIVFPKEAKRIDLSSDRWSSFVKLKVYSLYFWDWLLNQSQSLGNKVL